MELKDKEIWKIKRKTLKLIIVYGVERQRDLEAKEKARMENKKKHKVKNNKTKNKKNKNKK